MSTQIVTLKNSYTDYLGDILFYIAKGKDFGIWCGRWLDRPNWKVGSVSLKLSVGKRKRLIRGTLSLEYEGIDNDGEIYSYMFLPKQRTFSLKDRIQTRMKAGQRESMWNPRS